MNRATAPWSCRVVPGRSWATRGPRRGADSRGKSRPQPPPAATRPRATAARDDRDPEPADRLGRTRVIGDAVPVRGEALDGDLHLNVGLGALQRTAQAPHERLDGRAVVRAGDTEMVDALDEAWPGRLQRDGLGKGRPHPDGRRRGEEQPRGPAEAFPRLRPPD